jgi:hypothetical protein
MCLDEITGKDSTGTNTTVVRTLGTWETHLWPSKDLSIGIKQSVLLLETEPRLVLLGSIHRLLGGSSVVGSVGGTIVVVTFTQDKNVLAASERITEDGDRSLLVSTDLWKVEQTYKEDIRVLSGGLICGGTVKVPLLQLVNTSGGLCQSLGLGSKSSITVNPDVCRVKVRSCGRWGR